MVKVFIAAINSVLIDGADVGSITAASCNYVEYLSEIEAAIADFQARYEAQADEAKLAVIQAEYATKLEEIVGEKEGLLRVLSDRDAQIADRDRGIADLQAELDAIKNPPINWQRIAIEWGKTRLGQRTRPMPQIDRMDLLAAVFAHDLDAVQLEFQRLIADMAEIGEEVSLEEIDEVQRLLKGEPIVAGD